MKRTGSLTTATLFAWALGLPLPAQGQSIDSLGQSIDTIGIKARTRFLADDLLRGRATGSHGAHVAAAYIASEAEQIGLTGAGPDGDYFLPVPMRSATIEPDTRVVLRGDGDSTVFLSGRDFVVNTGGPGAFHDFGGPALLLGSPQQALDALSNDLPLRGRVVVIIGTLGATARRLVPAWDSAGVAGVLLLIPDPARFALYRRSRGDHRLFVAAPLHDPVWQPDLPMLVVGPAMAHALARKLGEPYATPTPGATDLGMHVDATIHTTSAPVEARNVAAVLPGSDPARRDEYIVYTAHFDHLGVGTPDERGDSIYNGFSDNAAGVAMLLAIAERLAQAPPPRSVLFLFLTGEERGLLGSSYLAEHPPIPLSRVRGLINLDAGAPPAPPVSWRIPGIVGSSLERAAATVAARHGWTVDISEPSPNSDYWPFLRQGVPAIFIIPGKEWENVSPAQHDSLFQRWDHYHAPADEWSSDFPFAGLRRYASFALQIGLLVAAQPAAPH